MHTARRFLRNTVAPVLVAAAVTFAPGNASAERTTDVKPRLGRTVATVRIPAIGLDVRLLYGIHDDVLERGLGLWPGTALPGKPGNAVVAGHRTSHGAPMRDIDKLQVGDRVYVTVGGKRQSALEYRITKRQIVRPDAMWITRPTKASTLTIFACHPPHSIAYRYVIFAKLVGRFTTGST
ncbi:MAG: sortase [Actinomycetota bacterium]